MRLVESSGRVAYWKGDYFLLSKSGPISLKTSQQSNECWSSMLFHILWDEAAGNENSPVT